MSARRNYWKVLIAAVALAMFAMAQDQPKKEIKNVPIKPTSAASGPEMYKTYCAVCHGATGQGNGPAADALKVPPADLTVLSEKNGGKYPALKVSAVIRGERVMPAHGNKEMPMWGTLFMAMSSGRESEVQQRVTNLNKYVEMLQKK